MATITHKVTTADTGNTPNTSGAFTPAVDDLQIVVVTKEASIAIADADITTSVGGTFTVIRTQLFRSGLDICAIAVANGLVTSAISRTITLASGSDPGAGSIISVYTISGMTKTGASAVRQSGGQSDQTASTTPAPAFPSAALTENACLGAVANATNPAGLTAPSGWIESQDTGYTTGAVTGLETALRNSGETGTTITWGSTSASIFASLIVEFDTSAPAVLETSLIGRPYGANGERQMKQLLSQ